ncbi:hydrogenase small subunit [Helicobacter canis]|uniref:Hydrogenase small subunit n=1 Tax=Helicobacter canis TaxID=29419 RepID=A0A5M9QLF5_9HELI|nr:hydrogenase small subunit [Helicobacter canis]KAA8709081.1 hydrogenase small subunit [Helicobacter canis]
MGDIAIKPSVSLEDKLQARLADLRQSKTKSVCLSDEGSRAWIAKNLALIGVPSKLLECCVEILEYMGDMRLVWLHLQECTGCSESLLRTEEPGFDTLIFDVFRLHYHDLVLAASGHNAQAILESIAQTPYILLVEGSVSMGAQEEYITLGGKSGYAEAAHLIQHAQAVFAVGTCSSYGGIQSAHPNPTNSFALHEVFSQEIMHIPGCPPSDKNIIGNLLYVYLLGELPPLDELKRPLWAYAKSVHDLCERRGAFLSGDFVESFDDPAMAQGYCLYKVGCKGPYTFNNCPKVKFNAKTSWPVQAGHGCIGCSEPNFWDNFGLIEEPISNASIQGFVPKFAPRLELDSITTRAEYFDESALLEEVRANSGVLLDLDSSVVYRIAQSDSTLVRYELAPMEINPALMLSTLESKGKQGARLVENYKAALESAYTSVRALPSTSLSSSDLLAWLGGYYGLLEGLESLEMLAQAGAELLAKAEQFAYPHISPLGFKWKESGETLVLDSSKALSNMLAYRIGGLDSYGVCFSIVSDLGGAFADLLGKWQVQGAIYLQGELFACESFTRALLKPLRTRHKPIIAQVQGA